MTETRWPDGLVAVQPRTAAFPEIIEATGGGFLCEAGDPKALSDAIEQLLLNPQQARALGDSGRQAVFEKFNARVMANETLRVLEDVKEQQLNAS